MQDYPWGPSSNRAPRTDSEKLRETIATLTERVAKMELALHHGWTWKQFVYADENDEWGKEAGDGTPHPWIDSGISGSVFPVNSHGEDYWAWRCIKCGEIGTDYLSERVARGILARHVLFHKPEAT